MEKKKSISDFANKVYTLLQKVPKGRVTTYGALAKAVGRPRASRAVGNILNANPYAPIVPCHRVVKSNGEVGGFASGTDKKIKILEKEGIDIKNGKVVLFETTYFKFNKHG
jgi:O-6-methylguanine DNA methyltransferase